MAAKNRLGIRLLLSMATFAQFMGCTHTSPDDLVLDEMAGSSAPPAAETTPPTPSLVPSPISDQDTTEPDDSYNILHRNQDGSTTVEVALITYQPQTRTIAVSDDTGRPWEEPYVVMVPVEEICTVTVPPNVNVQAYLDEHYPSKKSVWFHDVSEARISDRGVSGE